MSTVVDDRVVEMRFDNKQFEANVKTSMSTLEKLKKSLHLTGASKGLEDLGVAAKRFDTSGMISGLNTVQAKFSALQIMGTTALANITNSAVNAGKRIASALTIEPIKTGFQEYETQMNAVQTILANTQSKGTNLSQVNAALDELNYYADKTIYNFTEMTRNIGTFTAAGIDLDTSVSAIQGIANLAAVSGSTSQQASTAMYQLSQALAAGTVKLMDWNSVVNAGMGGEVFQNALKETSRLLNTGADAAIEAQGSFRESLSTGWLTSEVLTETLKKFTTSGANEYVAEYTGLSKDAVEASLKEAEAQYGEAKAIEEASKSLAEKSGKNEEEIKAALEMAQTAEDAATKVKTFTQLWDTMKEAAQSGWAQTWRLVVGDFEEAKEFFTDLSDTFGGIIEQSSNARNSMLEGALHSNWDKIVDKVTEAGIETEVFTDRIKAVAKESDIDIDSIIQEYGSLSKAFQNGAISSDILDEALRKLSNSTADLSLVKRNLDFGATGDDVKQIQSALSKLGYSFEKFGIDGKIGAETTEAIKAFQELKGLEITGIVDEDTLSALKKATSGVSDLSGVCKDFVDNIDQIGGRELLLDALHNGLDGVIKAASILKEAWGNVFPPLTSDQLYTALTRLKEFSSNLIMSDETADKFGRTMEGLFSVIKIGSNIVGGGAKFSFEIFKSVLDAFDIDILDVTANIGDTITKFSDWIEANNLATKAIDWTVPKIVKMGKSVIQWVKSFGEMPSVQKAIERFLDYAGEGGKRVSDFIERFDNIDSFSFENVQNILKDFKENVVDFFLDFGNLPDLTGDIGDIFNKFIDGFKTESENAGETIAGFGGYILNCIKKMFDIPAEAYDVGKEIFTNLRESIGDGVTGLIDFVDKIPWGKLFAGGMSIATALSIKKALGLFDTIASTLKTFTKITFDVDKVVKSINKVVNGVGKLFKSMSFEHNTNGIKNLAMSIVLLVGAIAVLTQLDMDDVQQAVKIIAELALILGVLAIVMSKISNSSITIGKKGADLKGLNSGLAGIAASVLMLAFTVKLIGNMKPEEAVGGFAGLILLVGMLGGVVLAFGKITKGGSAKDIDKVGTMLRKMATAMLLMVVVVKLISMLEWGEIGKGAVGMVVFVKFVKSLCRATWNAGTNFKDVGSSLIKISFAMMLLVGVIKLISMLEWGELVKGTVGVVVLSKFVKSFAKSLMPLGSNAPKIGSALLAMSASIAILAGVVALIGGIDTLSLAKGLVVVAVLGEIVKSLAKSTKDTKGCAGGIIAFSFVIGIMAAAVAALSMIDATDLAGATFALSALMLSFGAMSKLVSGSKMKATSMAGMLVAVGVLAGIVALLSGLPTGKAIETAGALSIMMIALGAAFKLIGSANIDASIMKPLGVMILALGAVALILGTLSALKISLSLETAGALSAILISMSTACLILSKIGAVGGSGISAGAMGLLKIAGVIGIITGVAAAIGAGMDKLKSMGANIEGWKNGLQDFMDFLTVLTTGLGEAIGGFFSGALSGLTSKLPEVGSNLSNFATNLAPFLNAVKGVDSSVASGITELAIGIGAIAGAEFVDWAVSSITGKDSMIEFMKDLTELALAIKGYATILGDTTIDPSVAEAVSTLAGTIGKISVVELVDFYVSEITGKNSMIEFMKDLSDLAEGIKTYAETIGDTTVDSGTAEAVSTLVTALNDINGVELESWVVSAITGKDSMIDFCADIKDLAEGIKDYASETSELQDADIQKIVDVTNAAQRIIDAANSIKGNIGGAVAKIFGGSDLATFSKGITPFGIAIRNFATAVKDFSEDDATAIGRAIESANNIITTFEGKENIGGLMGKIFGENDAGTYGKSLAIFGESMKDFYDAMDGIDPTRLDTLTVSIQGLMSFGEQTLQNGMTVLSSFGLDLSDCCAYLEDVDNTKIEQAAEAMKTVMSVCDELKLSAFDGIGSYITNLQRLVNTVSNMSDIDPEGAESFKTVMSTLGTVDFGTLATSMGESKDQFTSIGTGLGDAIVSGLSERTNSLSTTASDMIDTALTTIEGFEQQFLTAGTSLIDELEVGVSNESESVSGTFGSVTDSAVTTVENYQGSFYDAGVYLVGGLTSGIEDHKQTAVSAAEALASAVSAAVNSAFKINSPSRVFYIIGFYVVAGFVNALRDNTVQAERAAADMANATHNSFGDTLNQIQNVLDGNLDVNPTIRPVLDLSEIRARADALNNMLNFDSGVGVSANVSAVNTMMQRRNQNGRNGDVVSAIDSLRKDINKIDKPSYNINGITYNEQGNVAEAIMTIVQAARQERRC